VQETTPETSRVTGDDQRMTIEPSPRSRTRLTWVAATPSPERDRVRAQRRPGREDASADTPPDPLVSPRLSRIVEVTTMTANGIVTCHACRRQFFNAQPSIERTMCKNCDPLSYTRYTPRSPAANWRRRVTSAVAPKPAPFAWLAHPYLTGIGVISATLIALVSIWIALIA
jgi:hypothetical protein